MVPPPLPGPPPPSRPKGPSCDKTKFTVGKIWSDHFWYTHFWVPDPLLILPCFALPARGAPKENVQRNAGGVPTLPFDRKLPGDNGPSVDCQVSAVGGWRLAVEQ